MGENLKQRVTERANGNGGSGNGTGKEVVSTTPSLLQQIRDMEQQFQVAMPRGKEAAQLIRDAITAVRTIRNLDQCDAHSVLGALMTCAQLGLRPGVLGHAWPIPFWDRNAKWKDKDGKEKYGRYKAQLVIGFQGYRELAMNSGRIASLIARPVHEHDEFDIDYGVADNLVHKPKLRGDRGEIVGYYAIVKYINGGYAFWHMSKDEVIAHRDRYVKKDRNGNFPQVWQDSAGGNFDEMAAKTTFLRLAKWMPKSTEMAMAIEADGTVRVDLTPSNDAALHGEHPRDDSIDGEVVTDQQVTEEQVKQVNDTLVRGGLNRDTAMTLLSHLTGREITDGADLTSSEADLVIRRLGELAAQASKSNVPMVEVVAELLDRPDTEAKPSGGAR